MAKVKFKKFITLYSNLSFKNKIKIFVGIFLGIMMITAPERDGRKGFSRPTTTSSVQSSNASINPESDTPNISLAANEEIEIKGIDTNEQQNTDIEDSNSQTAQDIKDDTTEEQLTEQQLNEQKEAYINLYKQIINTNNTCRTIFENTIVDIQNKNPNEVQVSDLINSLKNSQLSLKTAREDFINIKIEGSLQKYQDRLTNNIQDFYNAYELLNTSLENMLSYVNNQDNLSYDKATDYVKMYEESLINAANDLVTIGEEIGVDVENIELD